MTTLCVVDMQDFFSTSVYCLDGVLKEIKLAMRRKAPIVVLEYNGCGRSTDPIRKVLRNYRKKRYVTKHDDDGGQELLEILDKKGWSQEKIRFAGVNRSACVLETVDRVRDNVPHCEVEIAIDATWCSNPNGGYHQLRRRGKLVNTANASKPWKNARRKRSVDFKQRIG